VLEGEPHHRGQSEGLSNGLQELRQQEVARRPIVCELARHETGPSHHREPERHRHSGIDKAKDGRHDRSDDELRKRDPQQDAAGFQRTVVLDRAEVLGNDVGRRKNDEAKEGYVKCKQR
jgi:hypothetical protein